MNVLLSHFETAEASISDKILIYFIGYVISQALFIFQQHLVSDIKFSIPILIGVMTVQLIFVEENNRNHLLTPGIIMLLISFLQIIDFGSKKYYLKLFSNQIKRSAFNNFVNEQLPIPIMIFEQNQNKQDLIQLYMNKEFQTQFELNKMNLNQEDDSIEKHQQQIDLNNKDQQQQYNNIEIQKNSQSIKLYSANQVNIIKNNNNDMSLSSEKEQQQYQQKNYQILDQIKVPEQANEEYQLPFSEQRLSQNYKNQINDESSEISLREEIIKFNNKENKQESQKVLLNCTYQQKQFDITLKDCLIEGIEGDNHPKTLIMLNDVSFRKQIIELQQKQTSQDVTLACITHDLKTPLNTIICQLKLAIQKNKDSSIKQHLDISLVSSEMMLFLVFDILDFSKILLHKQMRINAQFFELKRFTQDIFDLFQIQTSLKNINFQIKIDEKIGLINLQTDQLRLKQVVINLIQNSIKFTPEGGDIQLKIQENLQDKTLIDFEVIDSGKGMSEEQQKKFCSLFTTYDSEQGYGIGLYISQNILQQIGPQLQVFKIQSQPNIGSSFSFSIYNRLFTHKETSNQNQINNNEQSSHQNSEEISFYQLNQYLEPINQISNTQIKCLSDIDQKAEEEKKVQEQNKFNKKEIQQKGNEEIKLVGELVNNNRNFKFLIVDDEKFNHVNYKHLFQLYFPNDTVDSVYDGSEAIKILNLKGLEYYDLIIMDNNMPMTGIVTCRQIRQDFQSQVPIIFSSANNTQKELEIYKRVGGDDFFDKPLLEQIQFQQKILKLLQK